LLIVALQGSLEVAYAFTQAFGEIRYLLAPKQKHGDNQNHQQLGHAEVSHKGLLYSFSVTQALEITMKKKRRRGFDQSFDQPKEVRAIARERVGPVKPSHPILPKTSRKKPKYKQALPQRAEDEPE
jgi:hypothetical protein